MSLFSTRSIGCTAVTQARSVILSCALGGKSRVVIHSRTVFVAIQYFFVNIQVQSFYISQLDFTMDQKLGSFFGSGSNV